MYFYITSYACMCIHEPIPFSKTGCLTMAKEHSLPYYLLIAGGKIIGFIPFPRV